MNNRYELSMVTLPGLCDASGRIGYADTFRLFMDLASLNADELGIGARDLGKKGLFWLTVKTRVEFGERPVMGQPVVARTWPENPSGKRCLRSYDIRVNDQAVINGRTEWAVLNWHNGQLVEMSDVFPDEWTFPLGKAIQRDFARINPGLVDHEPTGIYTVQSTDIDIGGHMNNAAYVRALMNQFTNEKIRQMHIRAIDVVFLSSCKEGQKLAVHQHEDDKGITAVFSGSDGKPVFLGYIEKGNE